ncbi:MAG: hypothetical protein JWL81_2850 [Verrucomicrobiales bacterium]|nr:hypothetical protein [Verrucomicrobiales bacterium]
MKKEDIAPCRNLLGNIRTRVRQGQRRAALSANAEMIVLYWDIGRMIAAKQKEEGWGDGVIPRLAADLKNELPEEKGFSAGNIGCRFRFAREYDPRQFGSGAGGRGFAFVGRQFRLEISERDFYLDLLFYRLHLRCFVVVDLKTGEFKPEYAGKMNFYCSAVDDLLRHAHDAPTIGLILCQTREHVFAGYAPAGHAQTHRPGRIRTHPLPAHGTRLQPGQHQDPRNRARRRPA